MPSLVIAPTIELTKTHPPEFWSARRYTTEGTPEVFASRPPQNAPTQRRKDAPRLALENSDPIVSHVSFLSRDGQT